MTRSRPSAVAEGSPETPPAPAFATAFDAAAPHLYALALRIAGSAGEAESVVEQTLLEAWRAHPEAVREPRFGILARRCRDLALVRSGKRWIAAVRRRPAPRRPDGEGGPGMHPDLDAARGNASDIVARLDEADRRALEMVYFEGFRLTDVAACDRSTPGEVATRLRRAIAAFMGPGEAGPARDRIALCAPPAQPTPALRARVLAALLEP